MPSRARGVELLDRLAGSGYRDAPFLVRREDGQTFQLTAVLYHALEAIDGKRNESEIAAALGAGIDREVTEDDVRFLIDSKLRPLGVLRELDGSQPAVKRMNPLLSIRWRLVVSKPAVTRRITAPFTVLFLPAAVFAVVATFILSTTWLFVDKGLASAAHQVLYEPELLLLVFALMLASAAFHEFGHAAACRYGGATPGAMGVGLYLLWPVFYTDVSDAYRLGRGGRLRVDLGGLYFNAVFAVATFGVWVVTDADALLVIIPLQVVQMVHQLLPLVRLDGYHILADLTGVPDLFARIKPTLLALAPKRHRPPTTGALKPWVGVVVTGWVLVVVPMLLIMLFGIAVSLPRVAATAWDSIGTQWDALQLRWADGDAAGMTARSLSIMALAIPLLSMTYLLARVARRATRRAWRAMNGRPLLRAVALLVAASMLSVVAWSWWPRGQYEPIRADEQGTLFTGFSPAAHAVPGESAATSTRGGAHPTPADQARVPGPDVASAPRAFPSTGDTATAPAPGAVPAQLPGLLPDLLPGLLRDLIPKPSEIGEGDNQALAINSEDRSAIVALAFAIEWVTDGVVDNINEAYALASCVDCLTMAIAFQAVFIVGPADTVIPRNNAVAINFACIECLTSALAAQLVVTLTEPLDPAEMEELAHVWQRLDDLATRIEQMSPAEIDFAAELKVIEGEILGVLTRAGVIAVASDGSIVPAASTGTSPAEAPPVESGTAAPGGTVPPTPTTTTAAPSEQPPSEPVPPPPDPVPPVPPEDQTTDTSPAEPTPSTSP